jgi:hypothetical protein
MPDSDILDFIVLDIERHRDFVARTLEIRQPEQMCDIAASAAIEIVEAEHVVSLADDAFADKDRGELSAACYKYPFSVTYTDARSALVET